MYRPQGYAIVLDPDQPTVERDTITCGHCQRIVFVKPGTGATIYLILTRESLGTYREVPGAFCRVCMRAVCLSCHRAGHCTPWERMLEESEARDRFLRAAGIR